MIMRKCLAIGLLFCALCALAGCSDEEVVTQFNEVLQAAGEKVLTSEADLQGTRTFGEDGYVGTYQAQYDGFTGEETVFGGTALERDAGNEVTLSCTLTLAEGTAQVLFQSGDNPPEVLCDTAGSHSATLSLPSGGISIIVQAENATGSIHLTVE